MKKKKKKIKIQKRKKIIYSCDEIYSALEQCSSSQLIVSVVE